VETSYCSNRPFFVLLILFCQFTAFCHSQTNKVAIPKSFLDTVNEFETSIDSLLLKYKIPGAGIAVVTKDSVLYSHGFGYADLEQNRPVDENTLFRVGSISKSFVALAILNLVEQDLLTLEMPVQEIVPELEINNPWEETHPLRIVHLLEHTSGLNDTHFNDYYLEGDSDIPLKEGIRVSKHYLIPRWKPGQYRSYSSAGYMIAGIIIEKITGLRFEEYIKQEIFEPIGMTTSTFSLTPESETLLSQGYKADYLESKYWHTFSRPAGSMMSSTSEMSKFLQFMLNYGSMGEKQILSERSIGRMERATTDPAANAGLESSAGLGLGNHYFKGHKWFTHYGSIMGFCAAYGYCRDLEIGCVLLTNRWDVDFEAGMMKLWNSLRSYLVDEFEHSPQLSSVPDVSPTVLKSYQGYYKWCNSPQQLSVWIDQVLNYKIIKFELVTLFQKDVLFGSPSSLIPVTETTFRSNNQFWPSKGFVKTADDNLAYLEDSSYYTRTSGVQVWSHILFFSLTWLLLFSSIFYAVVWIPVYLYKRLTKNKNLPHYLRIRVIPLLAIVVILFSFTLVGLQVNQSIAYIGQKTVANVFFYIATGLFAVLSFLSIFFSIKSFKKPVKPIARMYAFVLSLACVSLTLYWGYWGIIGLKLWAY